MITNHAPETQFGKSTRAAYKHHQDYSLVLSLNIVKAGLKEEKGDTLAI